ncbi:MAG TPA: hypothetical protein VKU19_28510 [Bryobacteraceae bacterium]|nr:hypothetical protein [Bryobacteraceae bacterium]
MPGESFRCLSPEGTPVDVEVDFQKIRLHFADGARDLPFDAASSDLNAMRHTTWARPCALASAML